MARLTGRSGVRLTLATTAPGLQVYTGREIDSMPFAGHGADRSGPSTPLRSSRSSGRTRRTGRSSPITLAPGETFRQETRFSFSA